MEDLLKKIKDLKILNDNEYSSLEGIIMSGPYPKTKKELEDLIKESIKYAKKET